MRTLMGAVMVALGVLLVIFGLDATECLTHRISQVFHTLPGAKAIYFLAGGVLVILVGMTLAYSRRQHHT
jgi:hypothetical protein